GRWPTCAPISETPRPGRASPSASATSARYPAWSSRIDDDGPYRRSRAMIIRRVDALSVGKVLGCLYFLLGLIVGGIFSLFSLAGFAAARGGRPAGPADFLFGIGAVIVVPVAYGVIGLIGGLIMGTLYNVVASV